MKLEYLKCKALVKCLIACVVWLDIIINEPGTALLIRYTCNTHTLPYIAIALRVRAIGIVQSYDVL